MKRNIFFLVIQTILFGAEVHLWGEYNIHFKGIPLDTGHCHCVVTAVFQDHRGFMWFGTRDGICRYDGYRMTPYKNEPRIPSTLSNNHISCLAEDGAGHLWIGTNGGGINYYNREKDEFIIFKHNPRDPGSLSHNHVRTLFRDGDGSLWLGTDAGLDRLILGDTRSSSTNSSDLTAMVRFAHYTHDPDDPESISHNAVSCIHESPFQKGILWIGTAGGGLNRFDSIKSTFTHYCHDSQDPSSIGSDYITSICQDTAAAIWVGTGDRGLDRLDVKRAVFVHYRSREADPNTLSDDRVLCLLRDNRELLWIGTDGGGLCCLRGNDKGRRIFSNFKFNPLNPQGLRHNEILCLYSDRSDVLWIGTAGRGVSCCRQVPFSHVEKNPATRNGLSSNYVFALLEDRKGKLWIGTDGGGLNRYDLANREFTCFRNRPGELNTLCHNVVVSLQEDRDGTIWIGTDGGGLNRYDPGTDRFSRFVPDLVDPASINDSHINTIVEDRDGYLWLGTRNGGLNCLDKRKSTFLHYKNDPRDPYSLSHDFVTVICESAVDPAVLWVGTRGGGVNRFYRKTGKFVRFQHDPADDNTLSSDSVLSLYEDPSGVLWIGTDGGGLNRYDRREGTFTAWTSGGKGLPNNTIYGILGDESGHLWLSSNKGLVRFDPRTGKIKNFDVNDGLQSNVFNIGAFHKGSSGRMYFGGIKGFNIFDPADFPVIEERKYIPPIAITSFMVFNKDYDLGKSIFDATEIELNYDENFFSFEFALLDFWAPQKNTYTYRMKSIDKSWRHVGNRNFVSYTNLNPGKYVFQVRGRGLNESWSATTSMKIRIIPPFWRTWWFYLLSILLFALSSYLIIHLIKKYLVLITFWKKRNYLGNYKIVDKIGSGGIGVVYKAHKLTEKDRLYAVKVLKEEYLLDEKQKRRFKYEALLADQLDHPNIVKIYERGEDDENLYIVMELLTGESLSNRIHSLDLAASIHILIQIADVLVKLHGKNIVHRDLTPNNIMLIEQAGNPNFVKILDFGLARAQHFTKLTETGHLFGTVAYMPPEYIFNNRISVEGDIYSLGVIFYEMLTHRQPFKGESTMDMLKQIFDHNPPEPIEVIEGIPEELNGLVMSMIEEKPEDRPPAEEVLELLKHFSSIVRSM